LKLAFEALPTNEVQTRDPKQISESKSSFPDYAATAMLLCLEEFPLENNDANLNLTYENCRNDLIRFVCIARASKRSNKDV
jgi:hypothetical protein